MTVQWEPSRPTERWLSLLTPPALLAALAVPPLIRQPLWYDEVASRDASRRSLAGLWHLLGHTDVVFGPYYLLLHLMLLLGAGNWWLRLPSLLASIGTVFLVGLVGRRLLGQSGGLIAGLVYAANPFVVSYAHDARPYALATLGVTGAWTVLLAPKRSRRTGARYAVLAAAAIAAHLFAVLSLLPQVFLLRKEKGPWRRSALLPLFVAALVGWVSLGQRGQVGWLSRPAWWSVFSGWATLSGGWWVLPAAGLGLFMALRRRALNPRRTVVAAWASAPVLCLVACSQVHPVYLARYAIESTVPLALLAAGGAMAMPGVVSRCLHRPSRQVWLSMVAVLLVSVSVSAVNAVQSYQYENVPAAADFVRDSSHAGDGLVYLSDTVRLAMADAVSAPTDGQPSDDGPAPADLLVDAGSGADRAGVLAAGSLSPRQVPWALSRCRRLWVASWGGIGSISRADATGVAAERVLAAGWSAVESSTFGELQIALWQRR